MGEDTEEILDIKTFVMADTASVNWVRQLFEAQYFSATDRQWDTAVISAQRHSLASALDFYGTRLTAINLASFNVLHTHQKQALEQELLYMIYVFSAQYHLDEAEDSRQGLKERAQQIRDCTELLKKLHEAFKKDTPEKMLARATADSDKHLKYLGLTTVGPFIAEKMVELSSGQTDVVNEWIDELNTRRLYWVWGGGLLSSVIDMLSNDFINKPGAEQALTVPWAASGYMSWILYYTRFGIHLSLLLKHTIAGPWMSDAESKIPASERFETQWQQRKFVLLNDAIWATANLVCFFWLTGGGMPGYWGNVLTAGLLVVDLTITAWKFHEQSTQHNAEMERFKREIKDLEAKISKNPDDKILEDQLRSLKKGNEKCELDWIYKKYGLINDLTYSISLLAAFSVYCCLFFPPAAIAPATAMILGVVGGGLCFTLNTVYDAVAGKLEIAKSRAVGELAKKDKSELLNMFNRSSDEFQKKQLYLDIMKSIATSDYQQRKADFQKMQLVASLCTSVLLPPLAFVSFIFMPMGIGLAVIAAGLTLALAAKIILSRYEPKAAEMPNFNEEEYKKFKESPQISMLPQNGKEGAGFFARDATAGDDESKSVPAGQKLGGAV